MTAVGHNQSVTPSLRRTVKGLLRSKTCRTIYFRTSARAAPVVLPEVGLHRCQSLTVEANCLRSEGARGRGRRSACKMPSTD